MQPSSKPLSRRRILQTGSLLSLGLGLSQVMRLRASLASESVVKRDDTAVSRFEN